MTTPAFPDALPGVATFAWTTVPQVGASDNEIGPKTNRRRSVVPAAEAEVTWRFIEEDFATFQTFYTETLKRGHKWFFLVLPCAAGFARHVVRFKQHRQAPRNGYGFREVSAVLEVRERRLVPSVVLAYITTAPYPAYTLESVDTLALLVSGSLVAALQPVTFNEGVNTALVLVQGELRAVLRTLQSTEAVDAAITMQSGSLRQVLIVYDRYAPEAVNTAARLTSGTLRAALIGNTVPAEAVDTSSRLMSGSLVSI